MSNKYLGTVDGVMTFHCVRPDHSETVRDEHVLRRDYDALSAEVAALKARLAVALGPRSYQCATTQHDAKEGVCLWCENDALAARLAEQDMQLKSYSVLRRAVNESTNECAPDCDDHGHADGCPALSPTSWLEDQQREIERLRKEHAEMIDGYEAKIVEYERRIEELQDAIDSRDKAAGFEEVPALSPEAQQVFRAAVQEIDGVNLRRVKELEARLAEAERKLTRWHCVWCEHTTVTTGDVKSDIEALRVHSQTCDGNPLVRRIVELQKLHDADQARLAEAFGMFRSGIVEARRPSPHEWEMLQREARRLLDVSRATDSAAASDSATTDTSPAKHSV
jgi:hypothetical protein